MQLLTRASLDDYLQDDSLNTVLDELTRSGDEVLTCQKWLRDTPPKRYIYETLYGDLLRDGPRRRVLDVGGGLMSTTRELASRHDYHLIDLLAHDPPNAADRMEDERGARFIHRTDWYEFRPDGRYDIVIANDLFPNVDQRLEMFLEKFLPTAGHVRMALTFYNSPRFYLTRRVNADEYLCMLAWNGRMTKVAIEPFLSPEQKPLLSLFDQENSSVYPNGRQICLVEIPGHYANPPPTI